MGFRCSQSNLKWAGVNTSIANDEGRLYSAVFTDLNGWMFGGRTVTGVL